MGEHDQRNLRIRDGGIITQKSTLDEKGRQLQVKKVVQQYLKTVERV